MSEIKETDVLFFNPSVSFLPHPAVQGMGTGL